MPPPQARPLPASRVQALISSPRLCEGSLGNRSLPVSMIWKVLNEAVHYVELGPAVTALTLKRRKQRLVTQLKKLGYSVQLMPITAQGASL